MYYDDLIYEINWFELMYSYCRKMSQYEKSYQILEILQELYLELDDLVMLA